MHEIATHVHNYERAVYKDEISLTANSCQSHLSWSQINLCMKTFYSLLL
jgi:hypothetical protein